MGKCHSNTGCTTIPKTLLCLYWNWSGSNMKENERISYDYTLEQAVLKNDKNAEKQLRNMEGDYYNRPDWFKCLLLQRKYLVKYGGVIYGESSYRCLEKHFFLHRNIL